MFPYRKSAFFNRKSAIASATERVPPVCGQRGGRRVAPPDTLTTKAPRHQGFQLQPLCALVPWWCSFPAFRLSSFNSENLCHLCNLWMLLLLLLLVGFAGLESPAHKARCFCCLGALGGLAVCFSCLPAFLIHPPKIRVLRVIRGCMLFFSGWAAPPWLSGRFHRKTAVFRRKLRLSSKNWSGIQNHGSSFSFLRSFFEFFAQVASRFVQVASFFRCRLAFQRSRAAFHRSRTLFQRSRTPKQRSRAAFWRSRAAFHWSRTAFQRSRLMKNSSWLARLVQSFSRLAQRLMRLAQSMAFFAQVSAFFRCRLAFQRSRLTKNARCFESSSHRLAFFAQGPAFLSSSSEAIVLPASNV